MNSKALFFIIYSTVIVSQPALAINKCTSDTGKVTFQDKPCKNSDLVETIKADRESLPSKPTRKMSKGEKRAFKSLTYGHVTHNIKMPAEGCYDKNGQLNAEGSTSQLDGFQFTCLSRKPKPPTGAMAEIRQSAIESGVAVALEKTYLWFPKRIADYCHQHFPTDFPACIKSIDRKNKN